MASRGFEVPPPNLLEAQHGQTFPALVALMRRLLAADGCPWDRRQTPESLRQYVLEEACEVIDAIDGGRAPELAEELGDLLLQVVFLAELGRARGDFGPDDVVRGIVAKLVRRHPHVFGEAEATDAEAVLARWEETKRREKGERGLLEGVPRSLPALQRAQKLSRKAAEVGFDWPDARGSRDKVSEELRELDEALTEGDRGRAEHELGDLLFALVNLARHQGLDAELALRSTADRFTRRFAHVEARVRDLHGGWPRGADGRPTRGLSLEELDGFWEEAKRGEP